MNVHLVAHTSLAGPVQDSLATAATDRVVRSFTTDLGGTPGAKLPGPWSVLELSLDRQEALALIERLRKEHPLLGILVSNAGRGAGAALEAYGRGADLFTRDALSDAELMATIRAQVRWQSLSLLHAQRHARVHLELDTMGLEIIGPQGRAKLTVAECRLLEAFVNASGQLLQTEELCKMFGYTQRAGSLTVMMHRVRRKIAEVSAVQRAIRAHRSIGYELSCPLRVR